jgi:glycosyltransferase involved in cell wall biosynthesis
LDAPARGPARARNEGARFARGEWLVFVDADVRVHPDALRRIAAAIDADPGIVAVFGTYDADPDGGSVLSDYRNLLHRYVHCRSAGEAETFWAGCGAVRREAFTAVGGFDVARFVRPQIEDIELGYRLRDAGGRILLDPKVQGRHLKRWQLGSMLHTDFRDRGVPWMRLLLERRGHSEPSLNTTPTEQIKVGTAAAAMLLILIAVVLRDARPMVASAALFGLLAATNAPVYHWFARHRGAFFAARVIPLHLMYYVTSAMAAAAGAVLHLLRRPSDMREAR